MLLDQGVGTKQLRTSRLFNCVSYVISLKRYQRGSSKRFYYAAKITLFTVEAIARKKKMQTPPFLYQNSSHLQQEMVSSKKKTNLRKQFDLSSEQ